MTRLIQRRRPVAAGLALVGLALSPLLSLVDAGAQQARGYDMTAAASTATIELNAANAPLFAPQLAAASVSTAQAQLNSFGGSTAFAGAPFLGQTIAGVGGLVNGLAAGMFPPLPPTLPGYVASSNPAQPKADASQGPYTLTAESGDTYSNAHAGLAASSEPTVLSSSATASTTAEADGSLRASAEATTQPFAFGTIVQFGTVHSSAAMEVDKTGNLTQSAGLDLGTLTISGIRVGLTDKGLELLPGLVLPAVTLDALNAALKVAGITIELVPESKTPTSITSAGLRISQSYDVPVAGKSGVVITLGHAVAQLDAQKEAPYNTTVSVSDISSDGPTVPTFLSVSPSDQAADPPSQGPVDPTPPNPPNTSVIANVSLGPDAYRFYPVLVVAGLALVIASRIAGSLGVRARPNRSRQGT